MIAALALVGLLAAGLAWLLFGAGSTAAPRRRPVDADVDDAELEQAEQEVREAHDEHDVRDWGPGARQQPIR